MHNTKFLGQNRLDFDEIDSTNSYIKRNLSELKNGTLVTARLQNSGRGRLGNKWLADGGMLPFSILLKNPENPVQLTLLCAVAVARSLERLYETEIGIKWSNDIICNNYKVCGILCESVVFGDSFSAICGIGINLTQGNSFFKENSLQYASSMLALTGKAIDREAVLGEVLNELELLIRDGFSAVYDEYVARCVTLGKTVRLIQYGRERLAVAKTVATSGELICEDESGEFIVNSGEVSVRGLLGYV